MFKRSMLLATSGLPIVAAFENEPGWKMDGEKIAVDGNGDPIYIDAQGRESAIQHDSISKRNKEAQTNRERAEKAEADLKKFVGADGKPIDPAIALKAIETVGKLDAKKLIDAGEVDRVRDEIKAEFTSQLAEKDTALAERETTINAMKVDSVFAGSAFISEQVAMPRDFFEAAMRSSFKVEDGKVVAYDKSGNRIMSKKTIGEFADPDEALQLLVEHHPQKDTILKAPDAGGSGNDGKGGNRGGQRRIARSEFDALPAPQQAALAGQMGKGEVQIVD